jgi:hypothetical protein
MKLLCVLERSALHLPNCHLAIIRTTTHLHRNFHEELWVVVKVADVVSYVLSFAGGVNVERVFDFPINEKERDGMKVNYAYVALPGLDELCT